MSRVIVTGSSGFIGTNLVQHLLQQGHEVVGIDIRPPRVDNYEHLECSVEDTHRLETAFVKVRPEKLFHLAARTDLRGLHIADYSANVNGVSMLLERALRCDELETAILSSSRLVFGVGHSPKHDFDYAPSTAYGESKVLGEQIASTLCAKANFNWAIVRPTSIWGPFFGAPYRDFFDAVLAGRYVHPKGSRVLKSFGYVGNSVAQLVAISEQARTLRGSVLWLSDYEPIEVLAFANKIRAASLLPPIREVPFPILNLAAHAGNFLQRSGILQGAALTTFRLRNLTTDVVFDTTATHRVLPQLPFHSDDAISATLAYLKANTDD